MLPLECAVKNIEVAVKKNQLLIVCTIPCGLIKQMVRKKGLELGLCKTGYADTRNELEIQVHEGRYCMILLPLQKPSGMKLKNEYTSRDI